MHRGAWTIGLGILAGCGGAAGDLGASVASLGAGGCPDVPGVEEICIQVFGSGPIRAQTNFRLKDQFRQTVWRSNAGSYRQLEIDPDSGMPVFAAPLHESVIFLAQLEDSVPGDGPIQALTSFYTPSADLPPPPVPGASGKAGSDCKGQLKDGMIHQMVWRDDLGYVRSGIVCEVSGVEKIDWDNFGAPWKRLSDLPGSGPVQAANAFFSPQAEGGQGRVTIRFWRGNVQYRADRYFSPYSQFVWDGAFTAIPAGAAGNELPGAPSDVLASFAGYRVVGSACTDRFGEDTPACFKEGAWVHAAGQREKQETYRGHGRFLPYRADGRVDFECQQAACAWSHRPLVLRQN